MGENLFPLVSRHFKIMPEDSKNLLEKKWNISLLEDETAVVGSFSMELGTLNDELVVALNLTSEYDKAKYIEELYVSIARFAFNYMEMREVSTSCRHENEHRVKGLEKAGYVRRETVDACDHYSIKKQKTSWTGVYVIVGMIAGFIIGLTISNPWIGTIGGILIGILIGYFMDKKAE